MIKQLNLVVYYLAKKENGEISGLSDGPYTSTKKANTERNMKYGWKASDYEIVQTEQSFTISPEQ